MKELRRARAASSIGRYVPLFGALFLGFVAARAMELVILWADGNLPPEPTRGFLLGLLSDGIWCLRLIPLLFLPFLAVALGRKSLPAGWWFFGVAATLILTVHALLANFFTVAKVPLGAFIYSYSLGEIQRAGSAGGGIDVWGVLLIVAPVLVFWAVFPWFVGRRVRPGLDLFCLWIGVASFAFATAPWADSLAVEFDASLVPNRSSYFAADSLRYVVNRVLGLGNSSRRTFPVPATGTPHMKVSPGVASTVAAVAPPFRYLNSEYPFLREENAPDVLSPLFRLDPAQPPNLVFIVVEGLGRSFSGPGASLRSFTPGLDELAERSLYFENFLANQGRTFGVLPSLFASLPFGSEGFAHCADPLPPHHSLLSILRHQGYAVRFYGGFDLTFDNELAFLRSQGCDQLIGMDDFGPEFRPAPSAGQQSWGFGDRELMEKVLQMERGQSRTPFALVIQTMSLHSPFAIHEQETFHRRFDERLAGLDVSSESRSRLLANRDALATVLYADDAIRTFLRDFAQLPGYANTLFIITGDHRVPEIPLITKIDQFHVPLIIFSPLLKRPIRVKAVSSHVDVTPSLVALFKAVYGLKTPTAVPWIGSGLDLEPAFRNVHGIPIKRSKHELVTFLSGTWCLDRDSLFRLGDGMNLEPDQDPRVMKRIGEEFDEFRARNDAFARDLKVIPEEIYREFAVVASASRTGP